MKPRHTHTRSGYVPASDIRRSGITRWHAAGVAGIVLVLLSLTACAGSGVTKFVHQDYNFEFVERVAVVPFDNLTDDRGAGARTTQIFVSEILAAKVFDVVEPGEVSRVLQKQGLIRTSELTTDQIIQIGKELNVQGLFLGAITESANLRSGGSSVTKVSLSTRLVESERGMTVWSASTTAGGRGLWSSLFGTGGKSTGEVTRECVKKALGTLLD